MSGIIDTTITRLQQLALQCTGVKSAPQTPPESAAVLPLSVAFIASGNSTLSADQALMMLNIEVDIHVNRVTLKGAYNEINTIIPLFLARLAGDPTLNSSVVTIVYPVTFEVLSAEWNRAETLIAAFTISVKFREDTI